MNLVTEIPPFNGFSKEGFQFLAELENNNNPEWFNKNKERYDSFIVLPSKSFVVAMGAFIKHLDPAIRTEPKFNYTLTRINRDMRFFKDLPYRNFFLIHFSRFKLDSEFYLYIDKDGLEIGLFLNNTVGKDFNFIKNLPGYKEELLNTFRQFDLNNNYDLYDMEKEPKLLIKQFNIEKDFPTFARTKYISLQKSINKDEQKIYTADFINEAKKIYTNLYPVYCYSISYNPLYLISKFEEELSMGKLAAASI